MQFLQFLGSGLNLVWVAVALVSGGMLLAPLILRAGTRTISAAQAVQLINREKAVVIDVCGEQEFTQGHIAGAKNVPLDQLQSLLPKAVKSTALPVIFSCATGARAQRAAAAARKLGFERPLVLSGGLKAWSDATLPVEKSA